VQRLRIDSRRRGSAFTPYILYSVGGNAKIYGAALFRLCDREFEWTLHAADESGTLEAFNGGPCLE
jgi:hypothetical protein